MEEIKTDHYISVAKLRELLADEPDDALVVMSKDAEGNGFSPFLEIGSGEHYVADSSYSGELREEEYDPAEDGPDGAVPCIVLWSAN
jgi:hypothetical protein